MPKKIDWLIKKELKEIFKMAQKEFNKLPYVLIEEKNGEEFIYFHKEK